jgi:hypothetical protein
MHVLLFFMQYPIGLHTYRHFALAFLSMVYSRGAPSDTTSSSTFTATTRSPLAKRTVPLYTFPAPPVPSMTSFSIVKFPGDISCLTVAIIAVPCSTSVCHQRSCSGVLSIKPRILFKQTSIKTLFVSSQTAGRLRTAMLTCDCEFQQD